MRMELFYLIDVIFVLWNVYEYVFNYAILLTQTVTVISWFHFQPLFARFMK